MAFPYSVERNSFHQATELKLIRRKTRGKVYKHFPKFLVSKSYFPLVFRSCYIWLFNLVLLTAYANIQRGNTNGIFNLQDNIATKTNLKRN